MKKEDDSNKKSSDLNNDFLNLDIDQYLEELKKKYQESYNSTEEDNHSLDDIDDNQDQITDANTNKASSSDEDKSEKDNSEEDIENNQNNEHDKYDDDSNNTEDEDNNYLTTPIPEEDDSSRINNRKNNTKFTKISKILGYLLLIISLAITAYGGYLFYKANHLLDNSYTQRTTKKANSTKLTMTENPISILLVGLDNNKERNLDSTRTDSLIVCTFNPKTGKTDMVSIPRDTYIEMYDKDNGYSTTGKINAAYSINGIDSTINAVENLLDIPIDYYVQVDFDALEDVVNAFGGIYVDVPFTLTEQDKNGKKRIHLTEGGNQKLNGEQALAFARTRYVDNDIQRGVRQQEVIESIVNQALSVGSMTKYADVLQSLNGNIQTDMPKSVILGLAKSSTEHKVQIKHYQFKWRSFNYGGESFVALNQNSLDYISHVLQVQLGKAHPDERDDPNYQEPNTTTLSPKTYPSYGITWD